MVRKAAAKPVAPPTAKATAKPPVVKPKAKPKAKPPAAVTPFAEHGGADLPSVTVDTYNAEMREGDGFVGDRASSGAFRAMLDDGRERVRRGGGDDPLGDVPTEELGNKSLDKTLGSDDLEAAALVHGAIEDFASELAAVIRRFLRLKAWKQTERIMIGGGFRDARVGELAIGRAALLLKGEGVEVALRPIHNHPDEAGLIGAAHLAPAWIFAGHDSVLAVDIGGSNIRVGVVALGLDKAADLAAARVWKSALWRHRDDRPTREEAVARLVAMIEDLIGKAAAAKRKLAPFIGIGCPGLIRNDGFIRRGGQNLPGNWSTAKFNLVQRIAEAVPAIAGHPATVVMHNDAVVQGLSEIPRNRDVARWGILTIGTGLGNARFTNKAAAD